MCVADFFLFFFNIFFFFLVFILCKKDIQPIFDSFFFFLPIQAGQTHNSPSGAV